MSTVNRSIITDGLVLCLDAANPKSIISGSTVWNDISRSGNNGILTNGPLYNSSNGGSIVFDGVDDFINLSSPKNLDLGTNNFTISVWLYLFGLPSGESYPNGYWVFGTGPQLSATDTQIFIGANRLHFDLNTDNGGPIDVNHGFIINNWYNIVISRIGNTFNAYKNGVLLQTATSVSSAVNGYNWAIGKPEPLPSGTIGYFYGKLQNFLVYNNKGLTTNEVLQNYNITKSRFGY